MKASNDSLTYGWVARLFHWSVALGILIALGLGFYANSLPHDNQAQLATVFQTFSLHKTIGVAVLIVVALRLIWTAIQPHPAPLHPQRRLETALARIVHWGLWLGMVIMPLTGWLLHSAAPGAFSRILWPLGQRLPGVPQDPALAERFAAIHSAGWWLLGALIVLHVAGALKHALIDRDDTIRRMAGTPRDMSAPVVAATTARWIAPVVAVLLWGGLAATALMLPPDADEAPAAPAVSPATAAAPATVSGWKVESGTLSLQVKQGAAPVDGSFADWQAAINYDPGTQTGDVDVTVAVASLTLGSVTSNATGPEFLNAQAFPNATFKGKIAAEGDGLAAKGDLTIAGKTVPVTLPFTLTPEGDKLHAVGHLNLDRRDFGIGAGYGDESTVGFVVVVGIDLIAAKS